MEHSAGDLSGADTGVSYSLTWQTLPPNRDHARTGPLPPPSMLKLVVKHSRPTGG